MTSRRAITSVEDVQRSIPAVLREVNSDPDLARAALANPLLALEALGFQLDASVRPELERRTRFDEKRAAELGRLHRRIERAAHRKVDVDSPEALDELLFGELKLGRPRMTASARAKTFAQPETQTQAQGAGPALTRPLPVHAFGREPSPDPLQPLAGAHPVIEPLLAYRRLEASEPRLASRELFDAIRSGERELPVRTTKIVFRRRRPPRAKA